MKLVKISARGFKGPDFQYDLTEITVLFGRNFRGKSRVMDAIRLALLGYLPELGKRNQDTFGLATGPDMEICAVFDNGLAIRRRWSLIGNSVKLDQDVPDEIKAMGGLAVMLNAEEYFGLSDTARVNYVFANCWVSSSLGADDVIKRVEKLLLKEFPGEQKASVDRFVKKISEKQDDKSYPDCRAFLEEQIMSVADILKSEKAAGVRAEKAIQQITDQRLRDDPSLSLEALTEQRGRLERQLAELNEKKGRFIGSFTQMKSDAQRREAINRELGYGDKTKLQLSDLREKLRLMDQHIAAEARVEHGEIQESSEMKSLLSSNLDTAQRRSRECREAVKEYEKQLSQLDGATECPYCGSTGDGWKTLKAAELVQAVERAKGGIEEYENAQDAAKIEIDAAITRHNRLLDRQKAQTQLDRARIDLVGEISRLEPLIARLDTLAEELTRLMVDDPKLNETVSALQTEINITNEGIRGVDAEIKVANGRAFELKRLADAQKERDDAKVDAKVADTAAKELKVIQGEIVAEAFAPMLARANSFFAGVLSSPLAYSVEQGGEIGTWRDGLWIGHRTFSGTEKALTYAAIQASLAMNSPFRLMLLDELGRLDIDSMRGLVAAVHNTLGDGLIDQFVGIDAGRGEFYQAEASSYFTVVEVK